MNKIRLFFVSLLFFRPFGLDQVDKFGLIPMPMFSATKLFRVVWVFLIAALLVYQVYGIYLYAKRSGFSVKIPLIESLFVVLYGYVIVTSYLLSHYSGVLGIYRIFELIVILLSVILLLVLASMHKIDLVNLVQKALLINFYCIVGIIIFWLLSDVSMVYQLEAQGRTRLGGAIYSPNELGIIGCVSIWSAYYLMSRNEISKKTFASTVVLAIVIILLTNSRTSLFIGFGSILFMLYKQNIISRIIISTSVIVGIVLLPYIISFGTLGYGNDPLNEIKTLNNRTYIYQTAFEGIAENPWIGVGYVEGTKEYLKEKFTQDFWLPPHTHNGYIEIALSLGIPFLLVCVVYGLPLVLRSAKILLIGGNKLQIASAMQIAIVMLASMTTVVIGNIVNPLFVLFLLHFLTKGKLIVGLSDKLVRITGCSIGESWIKGKSRYISNSSVSI